MRHSLIVVACVSLFACQAEEAASAPPPAAVPATPKALLTTAKGELAIEVEVAATPDSRSRGLMNRKELAPSHGMVFVFPEETEHYFWMKNTYVSLDMIFVDSKFSVVGIVANAEPLSEANLSAGKPSKYVIEVVAGFAAQNGVAVGNTVRFENVPANAPR